MTVQSRLDPARTNYWLAYGPSVLVVVTILILWHLGSVNGWWVSGVLSAPLDLAKAAPSLLVDPEFLEDLGATTQAIVIAAALGLILGVAFGVLFWRIPLLGKMWEPYLISFYTVPLVVFYPIFIVVIGLGRAPIIILATLMAMIPMILNTWTGLASVRTPLILLARSLEMSHWSTLRLVALPAAARLVIAGATLSVIYAIIGVIAMEFMVAQKGLGHGIRYAYESFDNVTMYLYIIVTLLLSAITVWLLALLPRLLGVHRWDAQ